jgi:hypothetical protein
MNNRQALSTFELDILAVIDLSDLSTMRQVAAYLDLPPGKLVGPIRRLVDDTFVREVRGQDATHYCNRERARDLLKRMNHKAPPMAAGNRGEKVVSFPCRNCDRVFAKAGWRDRHEKACKKQFVDHSGVVTCTNSEVNVTTTINPGPPIPPPVVEFHQVPIEVGTEVLEAQVLKMLGLSCRAIVKSLAVKSVVFEVEVELKEGTE